MKANQEDRPTPKKSGIRAGTIILPLVAIGLLAAGGYYYFNKEQAAPLQVVIDTAPEQMPPSEQPGVTAEPEPAQNSLDDGTPDAQPLPSQASQPPIEPSVTLAQSDDFIHEKVEDFEHGKQIEPLLVKDNVVSQLVAFIDNLAQGDLARNFSPLAGPTEKFTVSTITNKTYLDPQSYHRFDLYADFISQLDDKTLMEYYLQLARVFTSAFDELGYSDSGINFNERLNQSIDLLLSTPIIEDPIELKSISVNYQFVDPKLEALPDAQKLLIRMGPENTRKIKASLRKIQQELRR